MEKQTRIDYLIYGRLLVANMFGVGLLFGMIRMDHGVELACYLCIPFLMILSFISYIMINYLQNSDGNPFKVIRKFK